MTDPLQALLATGLVPTSTYPPTSRYAGVPTLSYPADPVPAGGAPPIRYLARRLVPAPASMAQISGHAVVAGDRLDLIASASFSDPLLWWRIADANVCLDPAELTATIGRALRIAMPPGFPGSSGVAPNA